MSTVVSLSSLISRSVAAPATTYTKSATLAFQRTAVAGADTSIALKSAKVDSKTTRLTLSVPLQAGHQYTLRRGATGLSSTFTATLVDAAGKQTALSFKDPRATSFTVGVGGAYTLILSDTAPIKRQVDAMSLEASALEKTTNLAFARAYNYAIDARLNFRDAQLGAAATKLNVNLTLQAGRNYNFAGNGAVGANAFSVALIDAAGRTTNIDPANGFSVAATGSYQLRFQRGSALKSVIESLSLQTQVFLPNSSGDARIDALVLGGSRAFWNNADAGGTPGSQAITPDARALAGKDTPNVVTFGFLSSALGTAQDRFGFKTMSTAQKTAVRKAFAYYGNLINVRFKEVVDSSGADINFGTNNQRGVSAGYAYYPKNSPIEGKTALFLANDQWTNSDAQVQEGGYGWETLLHEIGHTLGLKHPGNYNAGGGGTGGPYLSSTEDDQQHSIMSYRDNGATAGINSTTAMPYDIAALQYLYGANTAGSNAVNGAFTFTAGKNYLQTLWSARGTDKIDLTGLDRGSYVDLNSGSFSSINILGAASNRYSGNGNVGIAYGSKINAVKLSAKSGVGETVALNDAFTGGGFNRIEGFNAAEDKLALKSSLFGGLSSENIEFGTAATKASSKLVVNRNTGEIFYDADGNGSASAARKIALYTAAGSAQFGASNFSFVA
jgi:hypothetical protein